MSTHFEHFINSHNELPHAIFLEEISMGEISDITTRNELADFLGIPRKVLTYLLYVKHVESCYTSFEITKKNGGKRTINAPNNMLKRIQQQLSIVLWKYQKSIWKNKNITPNISHAFEKNKSIITNANIHKNKRFVLNIDLENFFDSFHFGRVQGYFEKNKMFQLPYEVATTIAQLTCYNGCLPQGAPSSPIITNLISQIMDIRLLNLAKKYKLDYTRYADDLTFSTNDKHFLEMKTSFYFALENQINRSGFKINDKKTRLQYKNSRQEVTGLVVNKKLNVPRRYEKNTKAMAHKLYTHGEFYINGEKGNINQLEGRFSYINQLDRYNNKHDGKRHNFRELNGREKQYQKFLFYKYFFANDKPIIVTEGKTDILYIRAALKSLHINYPDLITKKENGQFEFKVTFFKKSPRLSYFFGISQDGADTMTRIYSYFSDKDNNNCLNYLNYFLEITGGRPNNPVIFLFDNELKNKKKPLFKFIQFVGLDDSIKEKLEKELFINVIDNGNLFLLTNQLIDDNKESEIENLFNKKTLEHKINGKTLSLSDNYDISKHYGKDRFSKYISNNYKDIDFTAFKLILDNLNKIVTEYNKKA